MKSSAFFLPCSISRKSDSQSAVNFADLILSGSNEINLLPSSVAITFFPSRFTYLWATNSSITVALVAGVPIPFFSAFSSKSAALACSIADNKVSSDTFCQGCLRTFFAVIQNQTLDFVAHGFFARFTEMDFDAVGGLSDFLYHYRWRGFLYGQRGSGCGGAAVAGVVVHRLSFP